MNHQNCFEVHFKVKPPIKLESTKCIVREKRLDTIVTSEIIYSRAIGLNLWRFRIRL